MTSWEIDIDSSCTLSTPVDSLPVSVILGATSDKYVFVVSDRP